MAPQTTQKQYPKVSAYPIMDKRTFKAAQSAVIVEALRLFQHHSIEDEWSFKLSTSVANLGRCHYTKKIIEISIWNIWSNTFENVRNTILHEIAHVLAGKQGDYGHGKIWKKIAISIGCTGERCSWMQTPPKYKGTCTSCGRVHKSNKMITDSRACSSCCKKYNNGKWHSMFIIPFDKNETYYNLL